MLQKAVFSLMQEMAPEVAEELHEELSEYSFPSISNEDRAFNLLVRETVKICNNAQLDQDGNRERLKRDALGTECGFCVS